MVSVRNNVYSLGSNSFRIKTGPQLTPTCLSANQLVRKILDMYNLGGSHGGSELASCRHSSKNCRFISLCYLLLILVREMHSLTPLMTRSIMSGPSVPHSTAYLVVPIVRTQNYLSAR